MAVMRSAEFEYKTVSVAVREGTTEQIGGIEVWLRPDIDAVAAAMAAEGWELHQVSADGRLAWLLFRRKPSRYASDDR
jgi:hypothetical protein